MSRTRVKFFSVHDLSCGMSLETAEPVLIAFVDDNEYININDVIELYNIKLFFDNKIFLKKWTDDIRSKYTNITKSFIRHIATLFNRIDDFTFIEAFNSLDIEYTDDFWFLFGKFQRYNSVSHSCFAKVFTTDNFHLWELFNHKRIVDHYGMVIRDYIMSDCKNATYIINKYMSDRQDCPSIHLPNELSLHDMHDILIQYIQQEEPHPNYLELISLAQNSKEFSIPDTMRLLAIKRHKELIQQYFEKNQGYSHSFEVSFTNQPQEKIVEIKEEKSRLSYSTAWIHENPDFPTLLNNFIYLFEYTDLFFRFKHIHSMSQLGIFERVMGTKAKNEYYTGIAFSQIQAIALRQMMLYRSVLDEDGIRLENIFHWFFQDYLKEQFKVDGFTIAIPSETSTDLEKCRSLASEIESILKQFSLYVQHGHIDHELLQISSSSLVIGSIPSLIEKKYIYGHGEMYSRAKYYLFSDQSTLGYVERLDKHYECLFDLLRSENVRTKDYRDWNRPNLEWLINNGFVYTDENEYIKMNKRRVFILKELNDYEVTCRSYLMNYEDDLAWFESQGMIKYESTLFSEPEKDYLNYLLNNSEFSNSLALRNKYIHGVQPREENVHWEDYNYFLNILVLIIIKINEEFCLQQEFAERDRPFGRYQQA